MIFYRIADLVGYSVCHQLPERTWSFGALLMPVCARCNGIYIGFFLSLLVLFGLFHERQSGLAPRWCILLFVFFVLSAGTDGLLSYLGIYQTLNPVRLITGYAAGVGLAGILLPVFHYQYFAHPSEKKILERGSSAALFLLASFLPMGILFLDLPLLGPFFYFLNAFSVFATFFFVNLVLVLFLPVFSKKAPSFLSRSLVLPSILAVLLALLELFFANRLHFLLLKP